jgi:hypothetical protein
MVEWEVPCEWCDAKEGQPCKDNHGLEYSNYIHIPRARLYDKKHCLHPETRRKLTKEERMGHLKNEW